jgi:hypothetical protein
MVATIGMRVASVTGTIMEMIRGDVVVVVGDVFSLRVCLQEKKLVF